MSQKMLNDDQEFFKQVMAEVAPLHLVKRVKQNSRKNTTPTIIEKNKIDQNLPQYHLSDNEFYPFSAEEIIQFSRPGFTNPKELRTGKWPIQAVLDLHGNTVDEARKKVAQFLALAVQHQHRCIKIIHGKGRHQQAILKNKVAQWLPQCLHVLAFCSASPKDGGSGAVYVLFKK